MQNKNEIIGDTFMEENKAEKKKKGRKKKEGNE